MISDDMWAVGDGHEVGGVAFDELFCDVLCGGGLPCCCRICMFSGVGMISELDVERGGQLVVNVS